jgi:hypothetical protein
MANVDAVDRLPDGSIVFSTATLRGVRGADGFQLLRPENAYRLDPSTGAIGLYFDGETLGLKDLDGIDAGPAASIAFSTATSVHAVGVHLKPQNAYTLASDGTLTLAIDGEALGLRTLDDFALRAFGSR